MLRLGPFTFRVADDAPTLEALFRLRHQVYSMTVQNLVSPRRRCTVRPVKALGCFG